MKEPTHIDAWHFIKKDRMLRFGHDPLRQMPGVVERISGPPVPCEHGLHASRKLLDALYYSPGPILCRVRVSGEITEGGDKFAGTERTILWMADATEMLHDFACVSALSVSHLWDMPDVVRKYLMTGTDSARAAAWDAARAAARAAAWDAARDAARAATWSAAWAATWNAARAAALAAVRAAEWAAEWDASRDASRDAARASANVTLERLAWMLCGPETAQSPNPKT